MEKIEKRINKGKARVDIIESWIDTESKRKKSDGRFVSTSTLLVKEKNQKCIRFLRRKKGPTAPSIDVKINGAPPSLKLLMRVTPIAPSYKSETY